MDIDSLTTLAQAASQDVPKKGLQAIALGVGAGLGTIGPGIGVGLQPPNKGLQATANSVRLYLAPALRRA